MTSADKRLRDFMAKNHSFFAMMTEEFAEEFYRLVRGQALEDTADYLTRLGTRVAHEVRKGDPRAARKIRELFYGAAHTVRTNGDGGREAAEAMLRMMRGKPDPIQTVIERHPEAIREPLTTLAYPDPPRFSRIGDEEDGDPA